MNKTHLRIGFAALVVIAFGVYLISFIVHRGTHPQVWDMGDEVQQLVWYSPSERVLFLIHYPLILGDRLATGTIGYLGKTPHGVSDKCPSCGSRQIHTILYGLGMEGGCVVEPDSPRLKCEKCKYVWIPFPVE